MNLKHIVEHSIFSRFILTIIIINAIIIGLETDPDLYQSYHSLFTMIDIVFLAIFTIEIALKLIVYRGKFFADGWNILDFAIVFGSLVLYSSNFVSVLRILRVLRVLRTISAIPSLRRLVDALFMAIPAIGSVTVLMCIIFYIYAIIGATFFNEVAPEYFGNLSLSALTLFQVFTLESWASGVFRPIFAEVSWSWIYFVSFIVVSTFIILNLIVGEIVNNAQKLSEEIEEDNQDLHKVMKEIDELKQLMLQKENHNDVK
ncbi:ion transporter [Longirhabdus pacifica]|uniref:ion transporter n=1 Tax=Longirhabdus pacifica TaxID=2305227 RepID=UPI001F0B87FE|nr:ion transporter [Longirhabdus pacifica]